MMILRSSPASPFGRKVKIAARYLGLQDRITIVAADTNDPNDSLRGQNPLGKIPALILADGGALYDSRVIIEYLDHLAGGGRLIPPGLRRFDVLRLQALADGAMDAALLQVYEVRMRPEEIRSASWTSYQAEKVARVLAVLEAGLGGFNPVLDAGQIAVACLLGYLDLRFAGAWRATHPKLVAWLSAFSEAVPAFEATRMP